MTSLKDYSNAMQSEDVYRPTDKYWTADNVWKGMQMVRTDIRLRKAGPQQSRCEQRVVTKDTSALDERVNLKSPCSMQTEPSK